MGYTVRLRARAYGHYETKRDAYAAIKKELCQGEMPPRIHMLSGDTEFFSWSSGIISVIPDADTP